MIRLKDTRHAHTRAFLKSAIKLAEYYGFSPLEKALEKAPTTRLKKPEGTLSFVRRDERTLAAIARKCATLPPKNPGLLMWRVGSSKEREAAGAATLELHIIGASGTAPEALLIMLADVIAKNAGVENRSIAINSIGLRETSTRYLRDIGGFLRKHLESISPTLRPRAATDPLGTLIQLIDRGHPITPRSPQSVEYLTEEERKRFWELLEYLEILRLPYELNSHILGSHDCWAHTLFEIAFSDPETGARIPFAHGGRYDPLMSWVSGSPRSAVRVVIECETRGRVQAEYRARALPAIYFAHLGPEARRKTFHVLELLRESDIAVHQSLLHERFGEQMTAAREHGTPFILVMGHKEAMENSVMVREVATNVQETVPIEDLVGYLKRRRVQNWKPVAIAESAR